MICSVSAFNAILRLWVVFTLALPAGAASAATILVYGDSLSSGYGLPREQGWASLLARRLQSEKFNYKSEFPDRPRPAIVVVSLGANDGLRGADLDAMRANLEAMADACRRAGARVLLVGMRLPPNYGTPYADKFQRVFGEVARNRKLRWVPFLLEGFGEQREYFQADGIHPTAAAQPLMLDTVWKGLRPLLKR
ncbi:MAG: arylesterase [Betaproteobacteria bacterium]|nr:arylesterase [Betaproteobacteria bacterium]